MNYEMWCHMKQNNIPFKVILVVNKEEMKIDGLIDCVALDEVFSLYGKDVIYFLTGYNKEKVEALAKRKECFEYCLNNNLNKEEVVGDLNTIIDVLPIICDKRHKGTLLVHGDGFDELYSAIKRMWKL